MNANICRAVKKLFFSEKSRPVNEGGVGERQYGKLP
jgi:hypothetical protein